MYRWENGIPKGWLLSRASEQSQKQTFDFASDFFQWVKREAGGQPVSSDQFSGFILMTTEDNPDPSLRAGDVYDVRIQIVFRLVWEGPESKMHVVSPPMTSLQRKRVISSPVVGESSDYKSELGAVKSSFGGNLTENSLTRTSIDGDFLSIVIEDPTK